MGLSYLDGYQRTARVPFEVVQQLLLTDERDRIREISIEPRQFFRPRRLGEISKLNRRRE
jgi:hypothetical protein